jgi:hypothetical protein
MADTKNTSQAKPVRSLASLRRDLAWLYSRINAGTDPTVQKYIAETKARIAAAAKRRGWS